MRRLFFWPGLILSIIMGTVTLTMLRVTAVQARRSLQRWQRRLGLTHYAGRLEPTHPLQVTGPDGVPGCELVGVIVEGETFRLVHTRQLDDHDIIHELLHVLWPDASHEEIEEWTDRLAAEPELPYLVARDGGGVITFGPKTEQPAV